MTTAKELSDQLDKLGETALKVKAQRDAFLTALHEVRELIEGYVDVKDGEDTYGQPVANNAMRAIQLIDEAIAQTRPTPTITVRVDADICPECQTPKCRHSYCPQCEVCQTCAEHTRTVTV